MDAAGVQAQQYDSEVNDRDQVFVDCMDTHANTEQRHGRPSDTEETDPSRSAPFHSIFDEILKGKRQLFLRPTHLHQRNKCLDFGSGMGQDL